MKVYIKYFDQEITRIEKITQGDWIDLRAAEDAEMKAGEFRFIRLGVGMILAWKGASLLKVAVACCAAVYLLELFL